MISLRWKIIVLCLVVLLPPMLLLNRYAIDTFDRFTRRTLENQMSDTAFIVGEQVKALLDENGELDDDALARLNELVGAYAREVEARIRVLSDTGLVLADSDAGETTGDSHDDAVQHLSQPGMADLPRVRQAFLPVIPRGTLARPNGTHVRNVDGYDANDGKTADVDLSSLPEVRTALAGQYRARWDLTPDRKYMFYYVARPIEQEGGVWGVVYVSRHTSPIMKTISGMVRVQRSILFAALGLGALLAAVLAHSITRRLRSLTTTTSAFARGQAPLELRAMGRDEIGELAAAIRTMADNIHNSNRYNREFVSSLMHELKMPITAIKGAAELLDQGAFDKPGARSKFLGNIRFEADRLDRLVWELNELTKLDTEMAQLQKEKTDYAACLKGIVERFTAALYVSHADIKLTLPEKPLPVLIHPGRIEQVVCNLLENALRYTPASGSIEIRAEEGPDRTVVTSVRDTGCGIAPANLAKIFDRFFTTEPKNTTKDYGRGLGLAIAKSIVKNHHGRIRAESTLGEGACFFFSLPLAE
ncbi:MAG: HAMP domain-containing protein [Lentisphaerae bacterium]|nr:HAMP domain-containing protein [Lentisphaerota bacterium]